MDALSYARVHEHLAKLKLDRVAAVADQLAETAAAEQWPYLAFLQRLLDEEAAARLARTVAMRTKLARFPFIKTLDQFDFAFQPSLDERLVRELASLRFVARAENVLFLGPPGVGKTHLAIALGVAAIAQGQHVHFLSAGELATLPPEQMPARLAALCKPKLLILDEMGYLPFDRPAAHFLFQLVGRRYERGSILLTSNKSFGEWGDIFSDQVLAAAILDRLLHHLPGLLDQQPGLARWTEVFGNERLTAALLDRLVHRSHAFVTNERRKTAHQRRLERWATWRCRGIPSTAVRSASSAGSAGRPASRA